MQTNFRAVCVAILGLSLCGIALESTAQTLGERSIATSLENGFIAEEVIPVRITITNPSASAQSITVTENVPEGFVPSDTGDGAIDGQTITWALEAAAGETTLSYSVTAPAAHINPDTPRLFTWTGDVDTLAITGDRVSNLFFAEEAGIFSMHGDIGDVDAPGYVIYNADNDEYAVGASGADIWGTIDEFQFVFNEMSGGFRIKATVEFAPSTHEWAMAGIMVRDNLSVGSAHAAGRIRRDGSDYQSAWRSIHDSGSGEASEGLVPGIDSETPMQEGMIELERIGNNIWYYYYNPDGERIQHTVMSIEGGLTDPVYVGIFSTSHADSVLGEGIINTVSIEELAATADVTRSFPAIYFKAGEEFRGITLAATVQSGDPIITETIPQGWTITAHQAEAGTVTIDGNTITWDLTGYTGSTSLVYDVKPDSADITSLAITGMVDAAGEQREILGQSIAYYSNAIETSAPYLNQSITLDGKIDPAEWEGATQFTYDRVDNEPPGHLIFGNNQAFDDSHTTVYVFHNDEYINLGLDVVDLDVNPGLGNVWESDGVEVSWNGNYSKNSTFTEDRESFQSIVAADGARAIGQFVPTVELLADGSGYFSSDGEIWNFGSALKEDGTGYVTEYTVKKSEILVPLDIETIGWSLSTNDAIATQVRESRYALWMVDSTTGETTESWNIPKNWSMLHLLDNGGSPVRDWSVY